MEKLFLISLVCFLCLLKVAAHQNHNQLHHQLFLTKTRRPSLLGGIHDRYFLEANTAPCRAWPELVGFAVADAQFKIRQDMPMIGLQVISQDTLTTIGYDRNIVRIYVDSSGIVTKPPRFC